MKKSILAVAGLAAAAGVVAPMGAAFADGEGDGNYTSYKDNISITVNAECSVLDNAGGYTGTSPIESTFSDTVALSTVKTFSGSSDAGVGSFSIVCNNDSQAWHLTAKATSADLTTGSYTIPSIEEAGTTPTVAASAWAFKMINANEATIAGTYNNWSVIPTSEVTVANGTGAGTVNRSYIVSVDNEQEPGTYTGDMTYKLYTD